MKKYLSIILLLVGVMSASAQDLRVKTGIIYKNNNTQDTIPWKSINGMRSSFYGKENPVDDDYIGSTFELNSNKIYISYYLSSAGMAAPYENYGFILSSQPITAAPPSYNAYSESIYFVDKDVWYQGWSGSIRHNTIYGIDELGLELGKTYYGRAYYVLDGKVYFSKETSVRVPMTRNNVIPKYYSFYLCEHDSILVMPPSGSLISDAYFIKVLKQTSSEVLLNMATRTAQCDDGLLYFVDQPTAIYEQASTLMNQDSRVSDMTKCFNYGSTITYQDYSREKWDNRSVMPRKGSGLSPQTVNRNVYLGGEYTSRIYNDQFYDINNNEDMVSTMLRYIDSDQSLPSWETYNPEIKTRSVAIGHNIVNTSNMVTLQTRDINPSVGVFDENIKEFSYIKGVNIAPTLSTAPFAEIDFKLSDVLATEYVIYVVTAPSLLDDEEAKADESKRKGMPLCFNINYCDAEGNIQADQALYGNSILSGKSTGPTRMVVTDPEKIDTICLGSVIFPVCYMGTDAYANLKISQIRVNSSGSETGTAWNVSWSNTYDKTMRISQIILRPKEYDDYLRNGR